MAEQAEYAYAHTEGPGGLHVLADGSLVRPGEYDNRYSRNGVAPVVREGDLRTETERDRGRIGYSSYLRRLAGVTQVVSPELTAARMHSRESHTHKVAMVARELAEHVVRKSHHDVELAQLIYQIGGLDISACEAAGLAHDLGHAPFGHAGEVELHRLLRGRADDGFEGNPQSFRIVTKLDGGNDIGRQAMDLTNVTLAALLKYPWKRVDADLPPSGSGEDTADSDSGLPDGEENAASGTQATPGPVKVDDKKKPKKFGSYESDYAHFRNAREGVVGEGWETNRKQSIEASIMDLADDIAYAIHDLEDFISAGMIDLHEVQSALADANTGLGNEAEPFKHSEGKDPFTLATRKLRETYEGLFHDAEYRAALTGVSLLIGGLLVRTPETGFSSVLKQKLSDRINAYFKTIEINAAEPYRDAPYVRLSVQSWHEIQVLKVITRHYLISSPRMGIIQRAQTRAIRALVKGTIAWMKSADSTDTLPEGLRTTLKAAGVKLGEPLGKLDSRHYRAIGDYVCGMSDSEALLRSNWVTGREIPGMTMVVEAF